MNTLKKGDKCQSPWGVVTINEDQEPSAFVTPLITVTTKSGNNRLIAIDELTRIPSKAERMQKMVDAAMDCENLLEPHETVQFTVEAFVEFARHYCAMKDELEECVDYYKSNAKSSLNVAESIEKLLKGETTI